MSYLNISDKKRDAFERVSFLLNKCVTYFKSPLMVT